MQVLALRLLAHARDAGALKRFYGDLLALAPVREAEGAAFLAGESVLTFDPVEDARPFYHIALRVPRNRFHALHGALARRSALLSDPLSGATVFEFRSWNALACYLHDPCGSIVELITHLDLGDEAPGEPEAPVRGDVLGICEVGLVGEDTRAMANALADLGIGLWDGTVDVPGRLGFAGGPQGTLILAPSGRGWVPTGRPAEVHPVDVTVAGGEERDVSLPGTPHVVRVRRTPAAATGTARHDTGPAA